MVVLRTVLYSRRSVWFIAVVAAAIGLWLARPGPLVAVDQQQSRLDSPAPVPHGAVTVGQSFVAQHNGLSAVEALSSVPAGATQAELTLRLVDSSGRTVTAVTLANLQHNQPLRLSFNPLKRSQGQHYTLLISADAANQASVWAYSLGGYGAGAMQVAGVPGAASLQFSTYYTLLWSDVLGQPALALGRLLVAVVPMGLVLFGPGLLMQEVGFSFGGKEEQLPGMRWGLALGLSLSVLPLLWLWVTVLGLHLSAVALAIAYGLVGLALLWFWLPRLWAWRANVCSGQLVQKIPGSWPALVLGLIVLLSLIVRLLAVRDLAFPSWVDSPHHALIVSLMENSGRVPDNYLPLLPVQDFVYHFGFHALAATLAWLTGWSTPDLFLLLGQVLNGLMSLAIYSLVTGLSGQPRAGLLGAFFVGLVSLFPAYYVSWGRYTQLTGGLILCPAVAVVWALVPPPPGLAASAGRCRQRLPGIAIAAVLAAGLALTHYRVLFFFAAATYVALALGGRGGWKLLLPAALLGGLMALPWLARLALQALLPALSTAGGLAAENGYNALPTAYFQSTLERSWLVIAVLAAAYGVWRRSRPVWFALAWTVVTFALLNIGPGTWVVNNNSWAIMLFVPGSLLLGWGGDAWLQAAHSLGQSASGLSRVAGWGLAAAGAGLIAWAGWRGAAAQISVANPATVLARAADAQAIDWIRKNTPSRSVFLVNGWEWTPGIWASSDAGAWLLPLVGRQTTLPPLDYIEASDLKASVNSFNQQAAAIQADSPETLAWLRANGITHVFIGAHGGSLKPEMFEGDAHYQLLYTNGPDWIFALRPEGPLGQPRQPGPFFELGR